MVIKPMTIWKYPIRITDGPQHVEMPKYAELLDAGMQGDQLVVWARVDPNQNRHAKAIAVVGTGHPVATSLYWLATVQTKDGLVWHVFHE